MGVRNSSILSRLKKTINRKTYVKLSIFLIVGIMCGTTIRVMKDKKDLEIQREIETRAFKVYFGEKQIGLVRDRDAAITVVKQIEKEMKEDYKCEIVINQELSYEDVHADNQELASQKELKKQMLNILSFNVSAYSLKVNGENLGCVKTKEEADYILKQIKQPYVESITENNGELEEVGFLESVEIASSELSLGEIMDSNDLLRYIQKGTTQEKLYKVEKGDSLWRISQKFNMPVSQLEKANPKAAKGYLHIGDELSLVVPKPFVTVVTKEKAVIKEKIGFDTKYENSSSMYKDETKVKKKGIYGEQEVLALVEKQNGIEVKKDVLTQKVLSQPKAQIVVRGTKEIPPLKGTGVFKKPTGGVLTSRYGPRWGSFHRGIDLASRKGTPIRAADGGVVTYTGYSNSYGYWVEISHGGGYSTRYAHCSKIYVKKGQKVYKDKVIAAVGNTGHSFGAHVHFEILKYGKTQNPLSVIGKKYR